MIAPGLPTGRLTLAGTSSGSSAAKSVTDWLMSGVSTRIPIALASDRYTAARSRLLFTLLNMQA